MSDVGLTHLDPLGRARMVDVTPKEASHRRAVARARVQMQPETTSLVARGAVTLNGQRLSAGDGAAVSDTGTLALRGAGPAEVLLFDLA